MHVFLVHSSIPCLIAATARRSPAKTKTVVSHKHFNYRFPRPSVIIRILAVVIRRAGSFILCRNFPSSSLVLSRSSIVSIRVLQILGDRSFQGHDNKFQRHLVCFVMMTAFGLISFDSLWALTTALEVPLCTILVKRVFPNMCLNRCQLDTAADEQIKRELTDLKYCKNRGYL